MPANGRRPMYLTIAKGEGWLDAIQYFSSVSLRSMQAWSHWEQTDEQWRGAPPRQFPTYSRWNRDVAAVTRLSNPDATAQHFLDTIRGIPDAEWGQLLSGFSDLIAFSLWMELVLHMEGPTSGLASNELANRYGGFRLADSVGSEKPFGHSKTGRSSIARYCQPGTLARSIKFRPSPSPRILRTSELCGALSQCLARRMLNTRLHSRNGERPLTHTLKRKTAGTKYSFSIPSGPALNLRSQCVSTGSSAGER